MEEVVLNVLGHDGMRVVKMLSDREICVERYQASVRAEALKRLEVVSAVDRVLGLYSVELRWPVFGRVDVQYLSPKKFRRFMMVHYLYATRVSECIGLAVDAFFVGTHGKPGYAFVRELPRGVENGMEIHGVELFAAEWMPGRCVAVGGRQ